MRLRGASLPSLALVGNFRRLAAGRTDTTTDRLSCGELTTAWPWPSSGQRRRTVRDSRLRSSPSQRGTRGQAADRRSSGTAKERSRDMRRQVRAGGCFLSWGRKGPRLQALSRGVRRAGGSRRSGEGWRRLDERRRSPALRGETSRQPMAQLLPAGRLTPTTFGRGQRRCVPRRRTGWSAARTASPPSVRGRQQPHSLPGDVHDGWPSGFPGSSGPAGGR